MRASISERIPSMIQCPSGAKYKELCSKIFINRSYIILYSPFLNEIINFSMGRSYNNTTERFMIEYIKTIKIGLFVI